MSLRLSHDQLHLLEADLVDLVHDAEDLVVARGMIGGSAGWAWRSGGDESHAFHPEARAEYLAAMIYLEAWAPSARWSSRSARVSTATEVD